MAFFMVKRIGRCFGPSLLFFSSFEKMSETVGRLPFLLSCYRIMAFRPTEPTGDTACTVPIFLFPERERCSGGIQLVASSSPFPSRFNER